MAGRYYIGIMTGTSLDAIDLSICDFSDETVTLLGFHSRTWPATLRELLLSFASSETVDLDLLTRVNFVLAEQYAETIAEALELTQIPASEICAVGLHGQTIRHLPKPRSVAGCASIGATLQWGSGSALAALTKIDVVSDFRSADVALGGQGAPLVPMFDFAFLKSDTTDRLITNIGGISNVTWLPAGAEANQVIAFDCGPGNILLDSLTQRYFGEAYDNSGAHARSGNIDHQILRELFSDPFFQLPPPKSTGRERFGNSFLEQIDRRIAAGELIPESALATLTELTAISITTSLRFAERRADRCEIIVSGGGAYNTYLMERISANAIGSSVTTSDSLGIPSQAKESIAFAYFAKARMEERLIHLPQTTGASRRTMLGSVSRGM